MVALTGRAEAYYSDTAATPQEFISAAKYGYLYQGQYYHWQTTAARHAGAAICRRRSSSTSSRTTTRSRTRRAGCAAAPADAARAAVRALTALLLLGAGHADAVPGAGVRRVGAVPLLRRLTSRSSRPRCAAGAREFLTQFPQRRAPRARRRRSPIPPTARTFERCKLDFARARHARATPTRCTATCCGCAATTRRFRAQRRGGVDGAVLGDRRVRAALLRAGRRRRPPADRQPRAPICDAASFAEPLLAPPRRHATGRSRGRARIRVRRPRHAATLAATAMAASRRDRAVVLRRCRARDRAEAARCTRRTTATRDHRRRDAATPMIGRFGRRRTPRDADALVTREWLVTNGLGGYASGTVAGVDHAPLSRAARSPRCPRRSAAW